MIVTIIVTSITAISAIVAPIITQWIAQRGAYRLKALEMFATAKMDAYRAYLSAGTEFINDPSETNGFRFAKALDQAILFSSDETNDCLRTYYLQIINLSDKSSNAFIVAHTKAVDAMHDELKQQQKQHKRS